MNFIYFLRVFFGLLLIVQTFNTKAVNFSKHEIPDEITILTPGKSLHSYTNLVRKNLLSDSMVIPPSDKKSFKIIGSYFNEFDNKIYLSGKARLTGDYKDHLGSSEPYRSSLSIKLDNTNIGGVVNFRLLLPQTRNGNNEIFWNTLMEEIGFPVPVRKNIVVNFNGNKSVYIFEEKPEKEFLESNGFRESVVTEIDERQLFSLMHFYKQNTLKEIPHIFQKKVKNMDFVKNHISELISLNALSKPIPSNKIIKLFDAINKEYASHGLSWHNRKYIYHPIYNDYLPIYFDGNVDAQKSCLIPESESNGLDFNKKLVLLDAKFRDRTLGSKLTDNMKCIALKVFRSTLKVNLNFTQINPFVENIEVNHKVRKGKQSVNNYFKTPFDLLINDKFSVYPDVIKILPDKKKIIQFEFSKKSNKWNKKGEIPYSRLRDFLSGDDIPKIVDGHEIYNLVYFNYPFEKKESFLKLNLRDEMKEIRVPENETKFITIDSLNSKLDIILENSKSKVVFYQSNIVNSKLNLKVLKSLSENENLIRYDLRLLTACNTIIDSKINNSSISSNNCFLEDNINFINVLGDNLKLDISNSSFDGFDADFSKLNITEIIVKNSGNDCIDVSSGIYNFINVYAHDCLDKAISLGEKSKVTIQKASLKNSNLGIAVKDLTKLHLNDMNHMNLKDCMSAYQKKQEFGYGIIYFKNDLSDCNLILTHGSKFYNEKPCMYLNENYFYQLCFKINEIEFELKNRLPDSSFFYINAKNNKEFDQKSFNKKFNKTCKNKKKCKFSIYSELTNIDHGLKHSTYGVLFEKNVNLKNL